MLIIFIIASIVSAVTTFISNRTSGHSEGYADFFIIMIVVLINAVLGVYQESKAEKAIEALQKLSAATSKVLRDGKIVTIPSEELVVGDVVLIEAGDAVPADGRILSCSSMKVEEAALTGESVPVSKTEETLSGGGSDDIPLGDRRTRFTWAAPLSTAEVQQLSPQRAWIPKWADSRRPPPLRAGHSLQLKLAQLSKILSILVLGICTVFIFKS